MKEGSCGEQLKDLTCSPSHSEGLELFHIGLMFILPDPNASDSLFYISCAYCRLGGPPEDGPVKVGSCGGQGKRFTLFPRHLGGLRLFGTG